MGAGGDAVGSPALQPPASPRTGESKEMTRESTAREQRGGAFGPNPKRRLSRVVPQEGSRAGIHPGVVQRSEPNLYKVRTQRSRGTKGFISSPGSELVLGPCHAVCCCSLGCPSGSRGCSIALGWSTDGVPGAPLVWLGR